MQLMKPMPGLDELLGTGRREGRVRHEGALGHQARRTRRASRQSSISSSTSARQMLAAGLVPIIEPEVDIHSPEKAEAEAMLKAAILRQLDALADGPAGDVQAHAARARTASTPSSSRTRRCCGWWRCRAATRATKPTNAGPQPRRDRQLLARAHRGAHRPADRRASSTTRSMPRSRASTRRR